jgi:hypothetical protein
MALQHKNVTVNTTPTLLLEVPTGMPSTAIQICNNHTATLYIGDVSVTTSGATRGNQLAANASVQIWLRGGDQIFGVTAAQTAAGAISLVYSGDE